MFFKPKSYDPVSVTVSSATRGVIQDIEIVVEKYHIHSVGFARAQLPREYFLHGRPAAASSSMNTTRGSHGVELGLRTNTVHFELPV